MFAPNIILSTTPLGTNSPKFVFPIDSKRYSFSYSQLLDLTSIGLIASSIFPISKS